MAGMGSVDKTIVIANEENVCASIVPLLEFDETCHRINSPVERLPFYLELLVVFSQR